jgi:hypothetical protein
MEAPVIAAWITGGFTIVAPIITFIATKAYQNRFLLTISPDRRRAIEGTWKGIAKQAYGPTPEPFEAQVTLDLSTGRTRIKGTGHFVTRFGTDDFDWEFRLTGGFLHDRFLRFNYNTVSRNVVQFGSIILQLHANSKRLTGLYQGYGVISENLVHGTLELRKVA